MAEVWRTGSAQKIWKPIRSMAFDCYFLGGVDKFVMDGDTITAWMSRDRRYSLHT